MPAAGSPPFVNHDSARSRLRAGLHPKSAIALSVQQIRVNQRIRAREVRVILASTNEQVGVMKTGDALRLAQSHGLDLVEVAPNAVPPVCRIVDYGKYRYELSKQEKEKKNNAAKLKEIKFRVNIDQHDYITKLRHAEAFLEKGNKVRVNLQFRGREMAHQELGDALVERIASDLATMGQVEMSPRKMGRNITMVLGPLPASKRKRKFLRESEEIEPSERHAGDEQDDE